MILDQENPWPALYPFEEAGMNFFKGRDKKTAELRRAVLHASLTILFGQSGLGKTSLLKAGLFPKLRTEGFLPIYLRLDVQDKERPLIEQLRNALFDEIIKYKVDAPPCKESETLWEYLHRRKIEFWSSKNRMLIPLFVLDQFEEVFTLGSNNLKAVSQLRNDLTDLIENRIPAPLVSSAEATSCDASMALELQCQRFKVLFSFREDFLPSFEAWKREMPSIMRNRIQLKQMTGEQAFAVVHETAPNLANETVAEEIVRFVASVQSSPVQNESLLSITDNNQEQPNTVKQPDLAELVVEPALLSLFCHGLNERRKQRKLATFDKSLLDGDANTIIEKFYQNCLKDLPERVHLFIENELITRDGYRRPCPEKDAESKYNVTGEELATIVNRWLIRIEPFHGTSVIELIHDVLAPVVAQRREERRRTNLFQQKEIEVNRLRARQQRKYRAAMVVCLTLLLGAAVLYIFVCKYRHQSESTKASLERISKFLLMRQAGLDGNQQKIEKLVSSSQIYKVDNKIKFIFIATQINKSKTGERDLFKYEIEPRPETLPDRNSVAIITYFTTNNDEMPFIATGRATDFKASYKGGPCIEPLFVMIEYTNAETTPLIAELHMCKEMGYY
jgi:hypothetical protein